MNSRCFFFLAPVLAGCVGIILYVVILTKDQRPSAKAEPQCAHWAIFRTAQLLGIPTEPGEIQRLLPNAPQGHSLAQIVEVFNKIGINAEGFKDNWDLLTKLPFPCIVHLANPDHFIVVSGIEPEQGYVHIFDSDGNRTRQRRESFEKRWTGYTLHITKNDVFFATKTNQSQPCAVYDHLILDKGDIPVIGEPTEFVFPIRNNGTTNLIIEDVKVNCGCLRSEKPVSPIPPGKSDVIKLFYSVQPKRGVFTQTAAVKTNDPEHPIVVLSACGFTGVDVRIEPARIHLDKLFAGKECVYHCFIRYTGEWNDFQVELESSDMSGAKLLRHNCVTIDKADFPNLISGPQMNPKIAEKIARNNRLLELVFEPTEKRGEKVNGTIILKTNVPGYEKFTLSVSGTINSPIQAFPSVIDLDKDKSVTLISLVDKPFSIIDIDCDSTITCQYDSVKRKEQTIHIVKKGIPKSSSLTLRCQLDNEQSPINLPLTLLDNVF